MTRRNEVYVSALPGVLEVFGSGGEGRDIYSI